MARELPHFPYHRDPMASGSLRHSDDKCECCGQAPGILYDGVVYSRQRVTSVCPWCIADGSATDKFDASFFDADFQDEDSNRLELSDETHREVFGCTIGFSTFNPFGWWVHCGEPAEYMTRNEPYEMVFECRRCRKRHVWVDLD